MESREARIRASDIVRGITVNVTVTGVRFALWRITLGCWFIRAGVWIAGMRYDQEGDKD